MPDYIPHTTAEIEEMLSFLGLSSLDDLFDAVPAAIRLAGGLRLASGIPEPDVTARFEELARANRACGPDLVCFAGGGAYDHEIPSVTRALASRSEFVTSYTPYQPEAAQGVLQAVFEFQSLVSRLCDLPVSNASLYDGSAALVEALNLGAVESGRQTVWMSIGVNPSWRQVARTMSAGTGLRITEIGLRAGATVWPETPETGAEPPGVVVVAYPNYVGTLEDVARARSLCDATGAALIVVYDPISAAVLRSPGEWGADVAVGEGQVLGMPLSFGGPYLGLFSCSQSHVRRLPGRLVGETVDSEGRRAYVTTLRAREQDIRREKATSNVCTNQTLMAVTAAIQLSWLGPAGLRQVALRCAAGTRYCLDSMLRLSGVEPLFEAPVFRECAIKVPAAADEVIERMANEGFLAGIALGAEYTGGRNDGLLVAVTEKRTRSEIDAFVVALDKSVR